MKQYNSEILLITLLVIVSFANCNNPFNKQSSKMEYKDNSMLFEDRIIKINKFVVDLTDPSALFDAKDFIAVYEHPLSYREDVINYISGQHTKDQKCIAIYSMAKLDVDDYIEFTEECYKLFQKKLIDEDLLERITGFPFTEKQNFIVHFNDKNVIKILNKIKQDPNVSDRFKHYIESILKQ